MSPGYPGKCCQCKADIYTQDPDDGKQLCYKCIVANYPQDKQEYRPGFWKKKRLKRVKR